MLARTVLFILIAGVASAHAAEDFTVFETGQVRPLALSKDGSRLFAVNTPDDRLEIFDVTDDGLKPAGSVFVGIEPVAVAVRSATEVWVVNHLSDSVSIVDPSGVPRVVRTLYVGDEPRDIVFAGPDSSLAFITAAHRGQNNPHDPQPFTAGVGRADVWVFDAGDLGPSTGEPKTIITLFGDSPRALAVSPDGHTVYAAIFLSGNRTTTVAEEAVCDGGAEALACMVNVLGMPGGLPWPNANDEGVEAPETGLIVKYNPEMEMWEDELGRNWNNAARFRLPDKDVFAIDAFADPPREVASYSGVGTVLYGMAVNPVSGEVYVSNTDARNEVRLEARVRGHQHESRLTVIGDTVRPLDLNKHLDCTSEIRRSAVPCDGTGAGDPPPPAPKAKSLALPGALAVSSGGSTVYLAAYGSSKIAILEAAALRENRYVANLDDQIAVSGGGPSGIVVDEERGRLYTLTRFDNSISTIDLSILREIDHVALFDREPDFVRRGRPFLYDAADTSANGEAACASCHVFGDFDGLAWDLGTTDEPVRINDLPLMNADGRIEQKDFHPLKGPMTTQTLQGLRGHGPMHWRGDRNGALGGGDPMDERAAFRQFNPSFMRLLGGDQELGEEDLESLTDFVLAITPPPNPYRNLDNSLTDAQQIGRAAFFSNGCFECHQLDPANSRYGTSRASAVNSIAPQFMKVPQLRNYYKKIGRFFGILFQPLSDVMPMGDQIRGFGFQHDGSAGRTEDPADPFLLAFDANLAPAVGQQAPLGPVLEPANLARVSLLSQRAAQGECDLILRGVIDGEERSWLQIVEGSFQPDRAAEPSITVGQLRALASKGLTVTCVPPGSGVRAGLDRDGDGFWDGDERLAGSDPGDPGSVPPTPTATATATMTETETPTPSETPTEPPAPSETPTQTRTPADTPTVVVETATPTVEVETPAPTETPTALAIETPPPSGTATPPSTRKPTAALSCAGDCDGDGEISSADMRAGVTLLFGGTADCERVRFDLDGDGRIVAAELLRVVREPSCF